MNRMAIGTLVWLTLALLFPAAAKDQAPAGIVDAKQVPPIRATPRPSTPSDVGAPVDVDARVCLEFPSNVEVIACAEKYRSQRHRG